MKVTQIAYVVLPVTDIAAARCFYESILDLHAAHIYEKGGRGMIDYDIEGGGRITLTCGDPLFRPTASHGGGIALAVDNFNEVVSALRAKGVPFVSPPTETADTHTATVTDPDGNFVIIHKAKAQGKKDFVVI